VIALGQLGLGGDVVPTQAAVVDHAGDHLDPIPLGGTEAELTRPWLERLRPIAERAELTPMQLACQWNLAHGAVECTVPTLIQETGGHARPIEEKRVELAALPAEQRLSAAEVEEIRAIGDNSGCMALKGAGPDHEGPERPDRWSLTPELTEAGDRWGIDAGTALAGQAATRPTAQPS
jgi:hypothetical protein